MVVIPDEDIADVERFGLDRLGHVRRDRRYRTIDGMIVACLRCDHDDCADNDPIPPGAVEVPPSTDSSAAT